MRINTRKIIQNLEVVNSFGLPISPTSVALVRAVTEKRLEKGRNPISGFFLFFGKFFFEIGSGAYPLPPAGGEGHGVIGVSALLQYSLSPRTLLRPNGRRKSR
jgi:hypothetical protein